MIDKNTIEQIKQVANIVDVVSEYIDLKRKGTSYQAFCPFHENTHTPAFAVSPSRNTYKCFGCDAHGDVIEFVSKMDGIEVKDAIIKLANRYNINIAGEVKKEARAEMVKVPAQEETSFELNKGFTEFELSVLGKGLKSEVVEANFNLKSVKSYITKKNEKGESWKVSSTPDFPIFVWEFADWGKIYQPLSKDFRFSYYGSKPENAWFGSKKALELFNKSILNNEAPEEENKIDNLLIVSGGSDGINTFCNGGFQCLWPNSESAEIDGKTYSTFKRIAKRSHILYDLDDTGIRKAYETGLKYLDLHLVFLPAALRKIIRNGKACKDVKDYFNFYRHPKNKKLGWYFQQLVKSSLPLQFWSEKVDKKGEFSGYEINNEQLYGFLNACGLYTLADEQAKKKFRFVQVDDNVVYEVDEEELQSHVNTMLINYIKTNLQYFDINLINTIHRSNQVRLASLEKLARTELDFKSFGKGYDTFFFQNTALLITNKGVEQKKLKDIGKCVYDFNILPHNYVQEKQAPFEIGYNLDYLKLKNELSACTVDAQRKELQKQIKSFPAWKRYTLKINDKDFSFLRFVYNTGRMYWEKEEAGIALTEEEQGEQDLNFINKVFAMGYYLYRYKERSKPWFVYGMETEVGSLGAHNGGTGKSAFFTSAEVVRQLVQIDGQQADMNKDDRLFSEVRPKITTNVYFDDINKGVDMHFMISKISGKVAVRAMYENKVTLDYEDSPKFAGTSNHALMNMSKSLKRRMLFVAFCDYYHPEDAGKGWPERNMRTEFGKDLIADYTTDEMNRFYNFMAYCLHTHLKFDEMILPPMDNLEKRNIQRELGDEFILWAEDYITEEKLNVDIEKNEIFDAYKSTLPEKFADMAKLSKFKARLKMYCDFKKYVFNPAEMLTTDSERQRDEIRKSVDGKDMYYYHIRTPEYDPSTDEEPKEKNIVINNELKPEGTPF